MADESEVKANKSRDSSRMSVNAGRESIGNDSMVYNDPAHNQDVAYIQEMAKLQENALLIACFKYF